jgi:hypothetical protein
LGRGSRSKFVGGPFLIILAVVAVSLLLGLAFLAAVVWVWIGSLRERRAVRECLRLHGSPAKGKIDELS